MSGSPYPSTASSERGGHETLMGQEPSFEAVHQYPPILIVEDDAAARRAVIRFLEKLNLRNEVLVADDGAAATMLLDVLDSVALVILDLHMPERSGLEVLAWLREHPRLSKTPVVMLTGSAQLSEIDEAYALGISSYLVKPVGFSALQQTLQSAGLPWALLAE